MERAERKEARLVLAIGSDEIEHPQVGDDAAGVKVESKAEAGVDFEKGMVKVKEGGHNKSLGCKRLEKDNKDLKDLKDTNETSLFGVLKVLIVPIVLFRTLSKLFLARRF
jgi:hypothetical protein